MAIALPGLDDAPAAPSVLRALNGVQRRLDASSRAPEHDASAELRVLARDLLHAVDLSHDVALACVLRNQVAGTYSVRHSVETAVIAALVARQLRVRPAHLLSLTAAALAMHAAASRGPEGERRDAHWFERLLLEHVAGHAPDDTVLKAGVHLLRMADRYCAGISARNYRRCLLPDDALRRVLADAHDAVLAEAFGREIGPWPPGCVVRLANGETGVVAHRDGDRLEVLCLMDGDGQTLANPVRRRIGEGCVIERALGEEDGDVRVSMKAIWGPLAAL